MKTKDFTPEQINFLKKLNALLTEKEKELWKRCMALLKQYEKRRKKNRVPDDLYYQHGDYDKHRKVTGGADLDDYEIEIIVEYQTSVAMLRPRYCYTQSISRSDYYDFDSKIPKKHSGIGAKENERFGIADGNDHADMGFPNIRDKWCYLMHALLDHSHIPMEKIFKIFRIDFEIHITEQQYVNFVENKYIA